MMSPKILRRCLPAVSFFIIGCAGCSDPPPVEIVRLAPSQPSSQVPVGGTIEYSATVENPRGTPLTYRWSAAKGSIEVPNEAVPLVAYKAPYTPGKDMITVEARSGSRSVASRSSEIEVVAAPLAVVAASGNPTEAIDGPPETPVLLSLSPRPEECRPDADCLVTARTRWVQPSQRGSQNLYVIVRYGAASWVQTLPEPVGGNDWLAADVILGQRGDPPGTPFQVCVVATAQKVDRGDQMQSLPRGPFTCVAVTRGPR